MQQAVHAEVVSESLAGLALENQPQDRAAGSSSSSAVLEAASSSGAVVSASSNGPVRFQNTLGIQGVGRAQRKGMQCLHCSLAIQKSELKFVYSFKTSKPARSIHVGCLAQIPQQAARSSAENLRWLLATDTKLDREARAACEEALATLTAS